MELEDEADRGRVEESYAEFRLEPVSEVFEGLRNFDWDVGRPMVDVGLDGASPLVEAEGGTASLMRIADAKVFIATGACCCCDCGSSCWRDMYSTAAGISLPRLEGADPRLSMPLIKGLPAGPFEG